METPEYSTLCRYQTDGTMWALTTYGPQRYVGTDEGLAGREPNWLKTVLDIATVGGHLEAYGVPPTIKLVWFSVDKDKSLISFTRVHK